MTAKERLLESHYNFRGRLVSLRVDTVLKSNGTRGQRTVVERADAVVILPVDSAGRVLLVRQYRHAVGQDLLELPAGSVDPGETAEQAAEREMREETGYRPGRLEGLGGFYSAPGFCTEYLHFFRATGLEKSPLTAEDTDDIEVVPTAPSEIAGLVASGQIRDAKSLAGFRLAGI